MVGQTVARNNRAPGSGKVGGRRACGSTNNSIPRYTGMNTYICIKGRMRRYPSKVVETAPKKKETDARCIWEKEIDGLQSTENITDGFLSALSMPVCFLTNSLKGASMQLSLEYQ
jgi:hypothetical protein